MFALRTKLGSNNKIFLPSCLKHTDSERKKVSTHCNLCLQNISSEVNENQVALKDRKLLFSLTVICLFLFVPAIVFNFSCDDRNISRRSWKQWLCKILEVNKVHYRQRENGQLLIV